MEVAFGVFPKRMPKNKRGQFGGRFVIGNQIEKNLKAKNKINLSRLETALNRGNKIEN